MNYVPLRVLTVFTVSAACLVTKGVLATGFRFRWLKYVFDGTSTYNRKLAAELSNSFLCFTPCNSVTCMVSKTGGILNPGDGMKCYGHRKMFVQNCILCQVTGIGTYVLHCGGGKACSRLCAEEPHAGWCLWCHLTYSNIYWVFNYLTVQSSVRRRTLE